MTIEEFSKCEEKNNISGSEHKWEQLGFDWGYAWIGLSIYNGFMATVGAIIFLVLFLPKIELTFIFSLRTMLGFSLLILLFGILIIFPIIQTIGLLRQKKWGLYLVYIGLSLGVLGVILNLITVGKNILFTLFPLFIIFLWFGYFDRRGAWFNVGSKKIPSPPDGTFPSSWENKDTLTIISLVLFLPIGLILIWLNKKYLIRMKAIITITSLLPFIIVAILAFLVTLRFRAMVTF